MVRFLNALLISAVLCLAQGGCAGPTGGAESSLSKLEKSLVFVPSKYPEGNWKPAAVEFEDVWFDAIDGTHLNGWFLPQDEPRAVILVAHGNAGNVTGLAPLMRRLRDKHHAAVFGFDYRGYGKSDGEPNEPGIIADARGARKWLAERAKIREKDVVLFGQSLGGAVAVNLAAEHGARGLILVNTFISLPDAVQHHSTLVALRKMENQFDSLSKIGQFSGRLLQFHAENDRVVPFEQAERLFEQAREPKQFVKLEGADHNDPLPEQFDRALAAFIKSLPKTEHREPDQRWHSVESQ